MLEQQLQELWLENMGQPLVYLWVEAVKTFLVELIEGKHQADQSKQVDTGAESPEEDFVDLPTTAQIFQEQLCLVRRCSSHKSTTGSYPGSSQTMMRLGSSPVSR